MAPLPNCASSSTVRDMAGATNRAERQLAIGAGVGACVLLIAALALWLRYGETVYTARVLSMLPGCF
jgi:hypothetical protein